MANQGALTVPENRGMELCRQVTELAGKIENDLRSRKTERAPQAAALYMFSKGYKSFQAAQLLFREGFWQDAASIGRTLLELGFQARWLNLNPEQAGRLFLKHEFQDRLKLLRNLKSSGSEDVRTRASDFLAELNSVASSDEAWRNWWSKEGNIELLAKELGLSPIYNLLYRPLCWFVHSAPFGNAYYLRETGGRVVFDSQPAEPDPKDRDFADMLFLSVPLGLMEVLAVADTVYELSRQAEFDRVNATLKKCEQENLERIAERKRAEADKSRSDSE